ncbi:restriction endonuclease [Jeotgalibacillus malaysiensis]|uniref:restriction endonuclease n=1 Tax=Jeotgalibacillus malaysiensis TaxID=1508404 RepID=UPI00384F8BA7
MIYNFRIDRTKRAFLREQLLNKSILYQGWGAVPLTDEKFSVKTVTHYKLKSKHLPNNLKRMRQFKKGDVLMVPHFPGRGYLTLLIVAADYPDCYVWNDNSENSLNHGIRVSEVYGLDKSISMYHFSLVKWYGKLPGMRMPVYKAGDLAEPVEQLLTVLRNNPEYIFEKSTVTEYLESLAEQPLNRMQEQLYHLNASRSALSFEKMCEHLIERYGYELVKRNCFDRDGGDADAIFFNHGEHETPFGPAKSYLFVQIKKHRGTTREHAFHQLIKIMQTKSDLTPATGCVITLADSFAEEALKLGSDEGIRSINGPELCGMINDKVLGRIGV